MFYSYRSFVRGPAGAQENWGVFSSEDEAKVAAWECLKALSKDTFGHPNFLHLSGWFLINHRAKERFLKAAVVRDVHGDNQGEVVIAEADELEYLAAASKAANNPAV